MDGFLESTLHAKDQGDEIVVYIKHHDGELSYPDRTIKARVINSDKPIRVESH